MVFTNDSLIEKVKTYHPNGNLKGIGHYTEILYVDSNNIYISIKDAEVNGQANISNDPVLDYYKKGFWKYYNEKGRFKGFKYYRIKKGLEPYLQNEWYFDGYSIEYNY